jgi:hypothetical protein
MITTTDKADFWRHHQRNWQGSELSMLKKSHRIGGTLFGIYAD